MARWPDDEGRTYEVPVSVRVSLSEERLERTTSLTPAQAVEVVTDHLRRLYPDARLEVSSMRGRLPANDPPHSTWADVHESCECDVVREPDRALGTRDHWG